MIPVPVFDIAIEEEEVETNPRPLHRTAPLYPTDGPELGVSWNERFAALKAPYREEPQEAAEEPEPEILTPMHEVEPRLLKATSKAAQVAKRLVAQGWTVRVGQSVARIPAVPYMSDSDEGAKAEYRKGDVRFAEHELTVTCLTASKRALNGEIGLGLAATWDSKNGFRIAETFDPILGREIRVGYAAPRKQNVIEMEDGVEPPAPLERWLAMVAPVVKKTREMKEAA